MPGDHATFLLPDNFVAAKGREDEAEAKSIVEEQRMLSCIRNVLDPLLKVIATDYVDEAHFQQRTKMLWNQLVTAVVEHESEGAQERGTPTELTREQVCVGFRNLDFESVLHFSDTDFDVLTEHGDEFSQYCSTFVLAKTCTGGASTLTNCMYISTGERTNTAGNIGYTEFACCVRRHVVRYIKRKLQMSLSEAQEQVLISMPMLTTVLHLDVHPRW